MTSFFILSVDMLTVAKLSVLILSVVMLVAIILSVIMLINLLVIGIILSVSELSIVMLSYKAYFRILSEFLCRMLWGWMS